MSFHLDVTIFLNDHEWANVEWFAVPRVGEFVNFEKDADVGMRKVRKVVWSSDRVEVVGTTGLIGGRMIYAQKVSVFLE